MRTVNFLQAGRRLNDDVICLYSNQRAAAKSSTIFHENDYSTVLKLPTYIMKENFRYNAKVGRYDNFTRLKYGDVKKWTTELNHKTY